ncbi:MAG: hypothetical protein HRU09_14980 [Oligoflexales bacterium]|nr:hypothetical protein [Oligoflexales bacterium]
MLIDTHASLASCSGAGAGIMSQESGAAAFAGSCIGASLSGNYGATGVAWAAYWTPQGGDSASDSFKWGSK